MGYCWEGIPERAISSTNIIQVKVAILTASIGGIDEIKGIPKQTIDVDYYAYFDNNLPYPLPNLNNRLKSKYVKIQTHRFLPVYDAYIWVDGRVEIHANSFAETMIEQMGNNDVALFGHTERRTVDDEMQFIQTQIAEGNQYVLSRYGNQDMKSEREFYQREGTSNAELFGCTIFARKNNTKVNDAFNEWWNRCIEFSYFDQTMFSHIATTRNLKIKTLIPYDFKKQFTVGRHVK